MEQWQYLLAAVLPMPLAFWIGTVLWRWFYGFAGVTKRTAENLLFSGLADEWNEFRAIENRWRPILHGLSLANRSLPEVDFSGADIADTDLMGADLSDADFRESTLKNVVLDEAKLWGARLDNCSLEGVSLRNAMVDDSVREQLERILGDLEHLDLILDASPPELEPEALANRLRKDPGAIMRLLPFQFEVLIAWLLSNSGYSITRANWPARDGYDLFAERTGADGHTVKYLVECRGYHSRREVGASPVRRVARAAIRRSADFAVVITNGTFNPEAVRAAQFYRASVFGGDEISTALRDEGMSLDIQAVTATQTE